MVIGQTSFRIIFAEIDHLQIFVFSSWAYFLSQNFKKVNLCKRKYLKIIFRILILSTFLWRRLKALSTIQSSSYLSEWITPRPPCHQSVPPRYLTKVQSLWPDCWLLETSSEGSLVSLARQHFLSDNISRRHFTTVTSCCPPHHSRLPRWLNLCWAPQPGHNTPSTASNLNQTNNPILVFSKLISPLIH